MSVREGLKCSLRALSAAALPAALLNDWVDGSPTAPEELAHRVPSRSLHGARSSHSAADCAKRTLPALSDLSTALQQLGLLARCEAAAAAQFQPSLAAHPFVRQQAAEGQQQGQGQQRDVPHGQQQGAPQQQQQHQQQSRRRWHFERRHTVSASALAVTHPEDVALLRQLAAALWQQQQQLEPQVRAAAVAANGAGGLLIASCAAGTAGSTADAAQGSAPAAGQAAVLQAAAEVTEGAAPPEGNSCMRAAEHKAPTAAAGSAAGQGRRQEGCSGGACSLPPRFTDSELMRFAIFCGYATARSAAERSAALQRAAEQVAGTATWLAHHSFATEEVLQRYAQLIYWDAPDSEGRPVLHIRLAAAVQHCKGAEALQFANAIITQMERAVQRRLQDGGPEQLCVVMDCRGGSALLAARISWVFKAVSLTLNHHYPMRLHRLELVDLPVMLQWLVHGVKKLVQPETRDKIAVVHSTL